MSTIIFIDDDQEIRDTYELSMNLMFDGEFNIVCLDVQASLKDMMTLLDDYPDKVSYFIDENLKYSGVATYTGIELIDEIRKIDTKIPIYILSSAADDIDNLIGNIEFVIDKNDWEDEEREDDLKQRFYRHMNTYKDIKSAQARRFDELFEKSLFSTLSEEELNEFNALNLDRSKKLVDEKLVSKESLTKLYEASKELDAIYKGLTKDDD